jgi:signal transduction histidine kinase
MEENLLCFMILWSKPNNQMYTQDDMTVFETLSHSTALAVENSFFLEEIQSSQRKERIKEMDIFAYSLAHEIDNPMQIIMGSYSIIKSALDKTELTELDKKTMHDSLEFMNESAQRVSGMVRAIRDFGKRSEPALIEIKDVVESFLKLYTPQFKNDNITLIKEIPEESIIIRGEKPELMHILINFAKNSIHAIKNSNEKKITIKVTCPDSDHVRISFSDTGYGISKERMAMIFAPFITTKMSGEGTGMGLYYVKKIVDRHKGKIWVESEGENKGTTLFLELPIAKDVLRD